MAVKAVLLGLDFYVVRFCDGPQDSGNLRTSLHAEGGREPLRLRLGLFNTNANTKYWFLSTDKKACLRNDCIRGSVFISDPACIDGKR